MFSGGQQRDSAIHIPVSILPPTPLPSRLPHDTEKSSLCYQQVLVGHPLQCGFMQLLNGEFSFAVWLVITLGGGPCWLLAPQVMKGPAHQHSLCIVSNASPAVSLTVTSQGQCTSSIVGRNCCMGSEINSTFQAGWENADTSPKPAWMWPSVSSSVK